MTSRPPSSRLRRWILPSAAALCGLCLAAPLATGRLLINETPSVPRGLYVRVDGAPQVGSLVAARQTPVARAYLSTLGVPLEMPLLKRVAAMPGDLACRQGDTFRAGDRRAHVLDNDRSGGALPTWRGCRVLADNEFMLLGDSATSFDSRYFGPVRQTDLLGVYKAALQW